LRKKEIPSQNIQRKKMQGDSFLSGLGIPKLKASNVKKRRHFHFQALTSKGASTILKGARETAYEGMKEVERK